MGIEAGSTSEVVMGVFSDSPSSWNGLSEVEATSLVADATTSWDTTVEEKHSIVEVVMVAEEDMEVEETEATTVEESLDKSLDTLLGSFAFDKNSLICKSDRSCESLK